MMKNIIILLFFVSCFVEAQELKDFQISDDITAGQLSANGDNCDAGNYPLGIDASGNAEDCTLAGAGGSTTTISDTATVNLTLAGDDITADVIESALVITESQISDLDHFSGVYGDLTGQPSIPANTSDLTNDDGFITDYTVTESDVTTHEDALTITESQISDLSHTVDTNTQNNQVDIEAFGFVTGPHTVDTDTQLSDAEVATAAINEGFVVGPHTVDTDTQLTQSEVGAFAVAEGFITGYTVTESDVTAHESALTITESQISDLVHNADTTLTEAQVDAFANNNGYSTGSHTVDTVLDETTVDGYANNNGYSVGAHTVDTNTQLSDAQVATAAINEGFVVGTHTVDTNTNASTVCAGATEVLFGDGSCGVPTNVSYITRTGRFYLYADTRWVTTSDDNYGPTYYQYNESGTTAVDPVIEWEWVGHYVPAGTVIKALTLSGRTNNTEVTEIELYLAFKSVDDAGWLSGYDNDGEDTVTILHRDNWMQPVGDDYGHTFTGTNTNDVRRRRIDFTDYTTTEDGYLMLLIKPVGTLTATRYFMSSRTWEVEY